MSDRKKGQNWTTKRVNNSELNQRIRAMLEDPTLIAKLAKDKKTKRRTVVLNPDREDK